MLPSEAFILPSEAFILPLEAFILPLEAFILPSEAFILPSEPFKLRLEAFTLQLQATTPQGQRAHSSVAVAHPSIVNGIAPDGSTVGCVEDRQSCLSLGNGRCRGQDRRDRLSSTGAARGGSTGCSGRATRSTHRSAPPEPTTGKPARSEAPLCSYRNDDLAVTARFPLA